MTTNEERRPAGNGTGAQDRLTTYPKDTPEGTESHDTRPRCTRCGHPLALPRSVARAYGRRCWARTAQGQLDARRDAVGRLLGSVARLVPSLTADALAPLSDALDDLLAAARAER